MADRIVDVRVEGFAGFAVRFDTRLLEDCQDLIPGHFDALAEIFGRCIFVFECPVEIVEDRKQAREGVCFRIGVDAVLFSGRTFAEVVVLRHQAQITILFFLERLLQVGEVIGRLFGRFFGRFFDCFRRFGSFCVDRFLFQDFFLLEFLIKRFLRLFAHGSVYPPRKLPTGPSR